MKYVNFTQISIKNFLSIGNDPVIVKFNEGIHIITGINRDKEDRRNGVGKSTIADAIYFAIFGTTIRDIKKDFIINNLTHGQCEVQLDFNVNSPKGNDNFTIIRMLNPSKLYVFKNKKDKTRDSIANTTTYIEEVLSSTPEVFQNCVIMTLNNTIPFMSKGKIEKRKFIEQIFNLQIFSDMVSVLREEHNNVKKNFDIEIAKHDEIKRNIEIYIANKESKERENTNKAANIENKLKSINQEIDNVKEQVSTAKSIKLEPKLAELDKLTKGHDTIEQKIEPLMMKLADIKADIKQKNIKHSNIGTSLDLCPVCLRPVDAKDRKHFQQEKENLSNDINKLTVECNDIATSLNDYKTKLDLLKKHINKVNNELENFKEVISQIPSKEKRINDLTSLKDELKNSFNEAVSGTQILNDLITESKTRLDNVNAEIDNIKKIINMLDVVKFVISEEGVKSYIVKKILQNFNSKLAYFLKKLDSNSICIFNEYFEEEILNEKGKVCSYNNFSGAERKAIDLACLFSFMDIRKSQGNVHYNISIYDELFDSSLDEKGVELVLGILKERCEKYNESIFVISHRKESAKFATGDVIFLEKYNGITKRVNSVD